MKPLNLNIQNSIEEYARQYLWAIIESSEDAIISKNLDGIITSWNKGAERIFGYSEEEILGQHVSILIPEDRRQEEPEIIRRLLQGERIDQFETIRKRKDGSLVHISLNISPVKDARGNIIGASKIARDISSDKTSEAIRKQAEENFDRERAHLRVLIDNLPDYIYFKDAQSRFIDANKATVSIMRCKSREDLIGKTDFDFYPREFAEKFFRDECEILSTGKSRLDVEESIIDEHKNMRILATSKITLKDSNGKIIGLVGIGRDITVRKQAEEVLRRDNEAFEKIIQERTRELLEIQEKFYQAKRLSDIGTLAAMVAHELRNPLKVIELSVECLKRNSALNDSKYLKNIEMKVIEGDKIIDNLLNYSKVKSPAYETVVLTALLDECASNSTIFFPDHEITIERNYDPAVSTIEADPYQLREVFANLLNNAIQAFANKKGKIEIVTQSHANKVSIVFRDNGIGMSKETLDKIFMPFFTSKSKGTGLGLAVCKEIVQLHGGEIGVQSRQGEGAQFSITLPVKKSPQTSPIN